MKPYCVGWLPKILELNDLSALAVCISMRRAVLLYVSTSLFLLLASLK